MNLSEMLQRAQRDRDLRDSTVASYEKFLRRIGVEDDSLSKEELEGRLLSVTNVNSRRSVAVAIRAVYGYKLKVPPGIPRMYVLPSEDTLRFALMQCRHETRALLMMYGGLRLGEACAVEPAQINGDRLLVDRQVLEFHRNGKHVVRLSPVKTATRFVILPEWLLPRLHSIGANDVPGNVRAAFYHWGRQHHIQLNPHMLRKWHGTWLLNNGANIVAVSKQLGHSNPSITMRSYIMTEEDDIRNAFQNKK